MRKLRDAHGWSQQQLALKARLNKATIVSVEKLDRNHGRETYERIAQALDLSLVQLLALVPPASEYTLTKTEEIQRAEVLPPSSAGTRFSKTKRLKNR